MTSARTSVRNNRGQALEPAARSLWKANGAILASTLLWGTWWIPLRELDRAGVSAAWATTAAFLLPLLVLLPFGAGRWRRVWSDGAVLTGGFLMGLSVALYSEGLLRGYVGRTILLFYLSPVWTALLARLMLGHSITGRRVIAIVLGLAGMFTIFGADQALPLPRTPADWMGLVSGACWALALVCIQRAREAAPSDKVFALLLFLAPCFWLFTLIPGGRSWALGSFEAILASSVLLLSFGCLWTPVLFWLTMYGASRLDPGRVSLLLMVEVIVGLASAALLTDESFGPRELAGTFFILSAAGADVPRRAAAGRHPHPR